MNLNGYEPIKGKSQIDSFDVVNMAKGDYSCVKSVLNEFAAVSDKYLSSSPPHVLVCMYALLYPKVHY